MPVSTKARVRKVVRAAVPWWAKGAFKLGLAHMPMGYAVLRSVALSRHGGMDSPAWAYDIFRRHFDRVDFPAKGAGFSLLELGPGDSLFTALIGRAHGASNICMVDVGPFANEELRLYRQMADFLAEKGLDAPAISDAKSISDVLAACGARYETNGLQSLRGLPDSSFDFVFSNAVLQAIRCEEVLDTLKELRRVIKPEGVSVHSVDLRDMMGQSLNHLCFSEKVWESGLFRRAGFHTNRLRLSEWQELARQAGFATELDEVNRWPQVPVARRKLAEPFKQMPDDELRVATVRLILRPIPVPDATADR
jgi:hypothetical protein